MTDKIKIGISSCLLGLEVRHDGSHKRDRYITNHLSEYFEFLPFCPEMAIGLGAPRPTIRLSKRGEEIRLVDSKNQELDYTDAMTSKSRQYSSQLPDLSGYILKNKSPSCGMDRVNLYNESGMPEKKGIGLFAQQLLALNPNLPIEEEGRLHDLGVRENFIERVFAYHRWQKMNSNGLTVAALMEFHQRHKLSLLAHDETVYRYLGKLVANTRVESLTEQADEYIRLFMQAMKKRCTRKRHVNVLQHSMGYLKKHIDRDDKRELLSLFDKYVKGQVPLVVPLTLLKYHFRKNPQEYISKQFYLSPYPEELMLRNNV